MNKFKVWMLAGCMIVALSSFALAESMATDVKPDPRLKYADKLIYSSHGAKKIEESENIEAKALHQQSMELYQQALAATDNVAARALLDDAVRAIIKAVAMVRPVENKKEKQRRDYSRILESVKALESAYERVSTEKGLQQNAKKVVAQLDEMILHAKQKYEKGSYLEARKVLDSAYVLLKTSIEHIRGGDTLVKSLNFATKIEEYAYEVDRNDTHRMLIKVLLQKKKSDATQERINKYQELAKQFRDQADHYATQGDFQKAIDTMDLSTTELVKAIRTGGVYIPG